MVHILPIYSVYGPNPWKIRWTYLLKKRFRSSRAKYIYKRFISATTTPYKVCLTIYLSIKPTDLGSGFWLTGQKLEVKQLSSAKTKQTDFFFGWQHVSDQVMPNTISNLETLKGLKQSVNTKTAIHALILSHYIAMLFSLHTFIQLCTTWTKCVLHYNYEMGSHYTRFSFFTLFILTLTLHDQAPSYNWTVGLKVSPNP